LRYKDLKHFFVVGNVPKTLSLKEISKIEMIYYIVDIFHFNKDSAAKFLTIFEC